MRDWVTCSAGTYEIQIDRCGQSLTSIGTTKDMYNTLQFIDIPWLLKQRKMICKNIKNEKSSKKIKI